MDRASIDIDDIDVDVVDIDAVAWVEGNAIVQCQASRLVATEVDHLDEAIVGAHACEVHPRTHNADPTSVGIAKVVDERQRSTLLCRIGVEHDPQVLVAINMDRVIKVDSLHAILVTGDSEGLAGHPCFRSLVTSEVNVHLQIS